MRLLVTGANGFLGHVTTRLGLHRGHQVRVMVRKSSDTTRIDGLPIERAEGDIRDVDSMIRAMEGVEAVIHLAGISDWLEIQSAEMRASIVGGTENVVRAALAAGKPRLVYASSISAINATPGPTLQNEETPCQLDLDDPAFVFVRTKREAEQVCLDAVKQGLPAILTNPPETFGPNDTGLITSRNLINSYGQKPVLVCDGGVCVGYSEDVANALVAAAEKGRPGERYIFGGENVTVRAIAEMIFTILGEPRVALRIPTWVLRTVTAVAVATHLPLPYNPLMVPFATRYWYFDNQKAVRELGVQFRGLAEAMRPAVEWIENAGLFPGRSPKRTLQSRFDPSVYAHLSHQT